MANTGLNEPDADYKCQVLVFVREYDSCMKIARVAVPLPFAERCTCNHEHELTHGTNCRIIQAPKIDGNHLRRDKYHLHVDV